MVTALPRWRWAGATAAGMVAAGAIFAACEAPGPVGPKAASDPSAAVKTERAPYSPDAMYLQRLAHQYHGEAFAHPLPGAGAVVVYWKRLKPAQVSDEVSTESMLDERPVFVSGPPLQYPTLLRQAGIQGRVMVRAIIDTTGRAEPASVQVVESPHPGFNQAARNAVLQARFSHGRFRGRSVRVLIEFPVEFRIPG